jgi:hypothetical protein
MRKVIVVFSTLLASSTVLACSGSTGSGREPTGTQQAATMEYFGTCGPAACADLPVPTIACAAPAETTTICEPANDGACSIRIECDSSPPSSLCDPSQCPAGIPQLAPSCPPGDGIATQCVSSGAACNWQSKCVPPSQPTCSPDACGPLTMVASICPDGSTASVSCGLPSGVTSSTGVTGSSPGGCQWITSCPGRVDGGAGAGSAAPSVNASGL